MKEVAAGGRTVAMIKGCCTAAARSPAAIPCMIGLGCL
jgi:hypothetical protein